MSGDVTTPGPPGFELNWPGGEGGGVRTWRHYERISDDDRRALVEDGTLSEIEADMLFVQHSRPRYAPVEGGGLLVLGAIRDPLDSIADLFTLRIWFSADRIVSVARHPLASISSLRERLVQRSTAPWTGEILYRIAQSATEPFRKAVAEFAARLDDAEEQEAAGRLKRRNRERFDELRRRIIWLRRFMVPQQVALEELIEDQPDVIDAEAMARLRELENATQRLAELLNSMRDHVALIDSRHAARAAEGMQATTYRLTVMAAIFLPLNFLAALLGVNLGGIPGADSPFAFVALCVLMLVIGLGITALLRWMRWL